MGAEQSSAPEGQLRSQRDVDIPYTSFSISRPIDNDTPRLSPRLAKTRGPSPGPKESPAHSISRDSTHSQSHDIVVVAEGNSSKRGLDPELQHLENIPIFSPLIKSSLNNSTLPPVDNDMLERLDAKQMLALCQRYQDHLKMCAEAVAFDQNALCVRIKEVDFAIQTIYSNLTERQKKFSKYAEQIHKVSEMSSVLNKVKMNVEQTVPLMERLNAVLPPEDQLEPFVMKPPK